MTVESTNPKQAMQLFIQKFNEVAIKTINTTVLTQQTDTSESWEKKAPIAVENVKKFI